MYSAHRSSNRPEAPFHMYPLELSSSMPGSSSLFGHSYTNSTGAIDALNGGPHLPRRRSHRPRGCRGGRKNRKNLNGGAPTSPSSAATYGQPKGLHYENTSTMPQNEAFRYGHSKARGEDLSPYQHVKTLKVWDFNAPQDNDLRPSMSSAQKPLMMLPPPVPSALFESRQLGMDTTGAGGGGGLKMLPSFEESDSASESLIPPPMPTATTNRRASPPQTLISTSMTTLECFGAQFPTRADEATIEALASNSSDDSDTVSSNASGGWFPPSLATTNRGYTFQTEYTEHTELPAAPSMTSFHRSELESGSLFVTSPRSFLLGETGQHPLHPLTSTSTAPPTGPSGASALSTMYSHLSHSFPCRDDTSNNASKTTRHFPVVW